MIKILQKNSTEISELTISEFEKLTGIIWAPRIRFQKNSFHKKALKKTKRCFDHNELLVRQKWLSTHLKKVIEEAKIPEVSIRWINDSIGYGVFAEGDFEIGDYIGEYTGLIRKRRILKDRKNDYCFEYTLGDWPRNPFVIDAQKEGNFSRFINHNEEPNLESLALVEGGLIHIVFIALKSIKKGEQLAYHYGDIFWKKRRHSKAL